MNDVDSTTTVPTKPITVVNDCSGCSDAGEIADRVSCQLACEGAAKMSCLAGMDNRVKSLVATAELAERILTDACPLDCAVHTLKLADFNKFDRLELHTIGVRKGSTPVTDERIADGVATAIKILAASVDANKHGNECLTPPLLAVVELSTMTKP